MLRMLAWACWRSFWAELASALSSSMYLASRSEGLQQFRKYVHPTAQDRQVVQKGLAGSA